jgi:ABC-type multidrug transport system permease subunit
MLKNYIRVAWRALFQNKPFSFINIFGLALGMASSLLILLWVIDELGTDKFHANNERLYMMYEKETIDGKVIAGYWTPGLLAQELKRKIPEIQYSTGIFEQDRTNFQVNDKKLKEDGIAADSDYFKIFSYPLLQGRAESALNTPTSIAISEKMARSLINWIANLDINPWLKQWDNNSPATAVVLRPGADAAQVKAKLNKFLDAYHHDFTAGFRLDLAMQPYGDLYLHGNFENGEPSGGRIQYVRLFIIVAVFILFIACINFMNLTTARSGRRAKEIGIRKVAGAMRGALLRQFLIEAILLSAIAAIVGLFLVTAILPYFNQLTNKDIHLPYTSPVFYLGLAALIVITGALAGSYPALFLSGLAPIRVLKGSLKFSNLHLVYGLTWPRHVHRRTTHKGDRHP